MLFLINIVEFSKSRIKLSCRENCNKGKELGIDKPQSISILFHARIKFYSYLFLLYSMLSLSVQKALSKLLISLNSKNMNSLNYMTLTLLNFYKLYNKINYIFIWISKIKLKFKYFIIFFLYIKFWNFILWFLHY